MIAQAMGAAELAPMHQAERDVNPVPKRLADISLAAELIGFTPSVPLDEGLRGLVAWWREEKLAGAAKAGEAA
jgi:UDP-glucose 4-epimerase